MDRDDRAKLLTAQTQLDLSATLNAVTALHNGANAVGIAQLLGLRCRVYP